jgi:hypothetical protein
MPQIVKQDKIVPILSGLCRLGTQKAENTDGAEQKVRERHTRSGDAEHFVKTPKFAHDATKGGEPVDDVKNTILVHVHVIGQERKWR